MRGPKSGQNRGSGTGASLANARAAWGEAIPEWIVRLAEAADQSSQTRIAKRLGYSGSVVSQVIRHSYKGDYGAVEQAVKGAFMAETVDCPVLGELASDTCGRHQRHARHFSAGSSMRVALYRTCRGDCPHSRLQTSETKGQETDNVES
ncbi:MAG: transcriptional regulator [Gammaproteobacteria bacterium]